MSGFSSPPVTSLETLAPRHTRDSALASVSPYLLIFQLLLLTPLTFSLFCGFAYSWLLLPVFPPSTSAFAQGWTPLRPLPPRPQCFLCKLCKTEESASSQAESSPPSNEQPKTTARTEQDT